MIDPRASAVSVVPEGRIAQDFVKSPEESSRSRLALVARELSISRVVRVFRVSEFPGSPLQIRRSRG